MRAAGNIRAVLLDLDDTLFDHQHCAREALLGVRGLHEGLAAINPPSLESWHSRILEELHLEVLAGRVDLDAARVERFRRLYRSAGIEADADLAIRTAAAYRDGYIQARKPVDGAARFLAAIRERAAVVIVSNNLLHEQREKLCGCDLDRHVDVLVVSEEVGVSKPASRIFEVALERAGVSADEAVMVGDSWANDVEGARAAGIRAVWFNRDGRPSPDPTVAVLRSLEVSHESWRLIFAEEDSSTRERA
ncbi:MAG: HAD-IA family hydrolase [Acidobacteriota bacterium]|nr:HAD-IA family hydrolase [Acidobacteriota bacterium]